MSKTPTRIYAVVLRSKTYLVEARSVEAAVQKATAPSVKKVFIPTPMELLRLQGDGAVLMTSITAAAAEGQQSEGGEGVGRLGLDGCNDGEPTGGDEGAPGENSEV
jgi:hypothetical protein